MIEYLKKLPDGISLPYMILKMLDKNDTVGYHSRIKYISESQELTIENQFDKVFESEKIVNLFQIYNRELSNRSLKFRMICISVSPKQKSSGGATPFIGGQPSWSLDLLERYRIEEFYNDLKNSCLEDDTTMFILEHGRDPFNIMEFLRNNSNEEDIISLKEMLINEPNYWREV